MPKQKTNQVFIHVSATYSAKNALEKHVLNELCRLNNLLCDNLSEAKKEISTSIERATNDCMTAKRCKALVTEYYEANAGTISFRVNDCIRLSLFPIYIKN